MKDKKENKILDSGILKIVGSIKHKSPRDLDVVLVLSDRRFRKEFGMSPKQWSLEGKNGNWSEKRFAWGNRSVFLGGLLQRRILKALRHYPLDFKIIPKSYDKKNGQ